MRYFLVQPTDVDSSTYVFAELAPDPVIYSPTGHDYTWPASSAQRLDLPTLQLKSEAELLLTDEGRTALEAWRGGDDSAHEAKVRSEFEETVIEDEEVGGIYSPRKRQGL